MLQFSTNLSLLRRQAGYTQEGLAEALHVSRQAVSKWESGQTLPEAATLLPLADLLGCSLDRLMRQAPEEEAPPPPPEPPRDWAVFKAYDRHMDRYAIQMAVGTILIMTGAGTLLSLYGMGIHGGLMLLPLLLCVGASVGVFIWGALAHEDFQRQCPLVPDLYTPEDKARFRWVFRLGMAVSVGALLLDGGTFMVLIIPLEGRMGWVGWAVALLLLLLVLSGSVGVMVLLGILEEKYDLNKYAHAAAKLRPRH